MVRLDTDGARASVELIEDEIATDGRRLGVSLLRRWVDEHRDDVFAVRRQEDEEAGQLAEMQRALDRMLGYGGAPGPEERAVPEMDRFVQWLEANHVLPGARVLLDRHTNRTGQNLTGHFRQCYFGVAGFLRHRADMIDTLDNALDMLGEEDIYELDPELRRSWVQYLDNNAVEQGEGYDIAILRGILPPSVGGTREGGGGGISTLKRIFPLVARFVTEVEG